MTLDSLFPWIVTAIPGAPAASFFGLAALWFFGPTPGERLVRTVVMGANVVSLLAAIAVGVIVGLGLHAPGTVHVGTWFDTGDYAFELGFHVDAVSIVITILVAFVRGLIAHFSTRYLHGQRGYARFFLLLALFATGMQLLVLGANIDQLFVGWELVGLSSALLVGYFHDRRTPVAAGLRVFITYRLCDLGLLVGAVLLHQAAGTSDLALAPEGMRSHAHAGDALATMIPLALLLAAMGKSAQFPVGGWLPRAMEGPTPSSALFYGALSVHAGVYLLLRAQPLFAASAVATVALIAIGATTAIHATLVERVQTDAKSALAYATMTQVGVMLVEIGFGLTTLALVHLVAHVLLRCHQLLRVPSAIRDAKALEAAGIAEDHDPALVRWLPRPMATWVYHQSLERFGLEAFFDRALVTPLLGLGLALDRAERRFVAILGGHAPPATPGAAPVPAPVSKARQR
jgi:NADH:ubiquinone oxidoreductase subunit 5 (subunit L)/multisubunit Na+/H+ antiporter MnhA subunit